MKKIVILSIIFLPFSAFANEVPKNNLELQCPYCPCLQNENGEEKEEDVEKYKYISLKIGGVYGTLRSDREDMNLVGPSVNVAYGGKTGNNRIEFEYSYIPMEGDETILMQIPL